jgi:hypothetical protein
LEEKAFMRAKYLAMLGVNGDFRYIGPEYYTDWFNQELSYQSGTFEINRLSGCEILLLPTQTRSSKYRWLFGPLATYRFFPHPKIVFATTWLDYLKSSYICSLLLEDIINLVASRSDYIVVL